MKEVNYIRMTLMLERIHTKEDESKQGLGFKAMNCKEKTLNRRRLLFQNKRKLRDHVTSCQNQLAKAAALQTKSQSTF